ncbi:MAG: 2-C-methyl-D-erythritol 2,4-cyclodiphosphate synthase [Clostridia bacterium]|nr:2-C-methyl-D-erythritol 2,4-cyclodiphosphate synthase [Clostridia bacterium]
MVKIGYGYDAHRLVEGRKLIIGGVDIPYEKGLLGHSDADVLTHAVIDAIIGALGAGDIGKHFPDSDMAYKDADSLVLLRRTFEIMRERGYKIGNVDATVVAQKPRLAPHISAMCENLARVLECPPDDVNIKGKTTEGMGFEGKGEGISAHAVALITSEV